MYHYVNFLLCKNCTIIQSWDSTDRFMEKEKAMEMAQTIVRNLQDSGYKIYYRIMHN